MLWSVSIGEGKTMYADVTVIVDGAVGTENTFYDYALMEQFIDTIRDEAMGDGYPTDVYIQYHEHDMTDNECMCAQYETDHHPDYSWNNDGPGTGF